jgi:pimeloyl-ACP methyl ester carboxylesterase
VNVAMVPVGERRRIAVAELGTGAPLLYLHDFFDVHGASADWLPFHERLGERFRVIAPAYAGCSGSDEDEDALGFEDAVFDVLAVLDALGLDAVPAVGNGIGGWIAAELAVRDRRLVERLVLIGATGLFVERCPIADVFYDAQPRDGTSMQELRRTFFGDPASTLAHAWIPDGRMSVERELRRYAMFRFAARIGFRPPYFYDRRLRERLARYTGPTSILWGADDRFVPLAHGEAYAAALPNAHLEVLGDCGHCLHLERPEAAVGLIENMLGFEWRRE